MKKTLLLTLLCAVVVAKADQSPLFGLKGYDIGQELAECPPNTVQASTDNVGVTICNLPADTLAGQPFSLLQLRILDKRVIGVAVALDRRGINSNAEVRNALLEKYGRPDEAKPHINRFVWRRGDHMLELDGLNGFVLAADVPANNAAARARAQKNKKDL